jgi:methylenetetrahydrofolate dehydrogenase (NADP+)/methenyltetrahydrofolate cyclohydrolase
MNEPHSLDQNEVVRIGQIIDGKKFAARVRAEVADAAEDLARRNVRPGLAVVIVGDDPASQVYVRNKIVQANGAGIVSFDHALPAFIDEASLLALIAQLNADVRVSGILVQLPLPSHIDAQKILEAIEPAKDVDGFHPSNVGRLATGAPSLVPCTPLGCMLMLRSISPDLAGLDAVVIGRSSIVGKPMAQLLMRASCTVTVAHSRTKNLPDVCRRADIIVAAVGRPQFVRGDWIKPGALVIDVGINRVISDGGKTRLVGDVAFNEASKVAGAITPVPGGVGPMTIPCLLRNTVEAAARLHSLPRPAWRLEVC